MSSCDVTAGDIGNIAHSPNSISAASKSSISSNRMAGQGTGLAAGPQQNRQALQQPTYGPHNQPQHQQAATFMPGLKPIRTVVTSQGTFMAPHPVTNNGTWAFWQASPTQPAPPHNPSLVNRLDTGYHAGCTKTAAGGAANPRCDVISTKKCGASPKLPETPPVGDSDNQQSQEQHSAQPATFASVAELSKIRGYTVTTGLHGLEQQTSSLRAAIASPLGFQNHSFSAQNLSSNNRLSAGPGSPIVTRVSLTDWQQLYVHASNQPVERAASQPAVATTTQAAAAPAKVAAVQDVLPAYTLRTPSEELNSKTAVTDRLASFAPGVASPKAADSKSLPSDCNMAADPALLAAASAAAALQQAAMASAAAGSRSSTSFDCELALQSLAASADLGDLDVPPVPKGFETSTATMSEATAAVAASLPPVLALHTAHTTYTAPGTDSQEDDSDVTQLLGSYTLPEYQQMQHLDKFARQQLVVYLHIRRQALQDAEMVVKKREAWHKQRTVVYGPTSVNAALSGSSKYQEVLQEVQAAERAVDDLLLRLLLQEQHDQQQQQAAAQHQQQPSSMVSNNIEVLLFQSQQPVVGSLVTDTVTAAHTGKQLGNKRLSRFAKEAAAAARQQHVAAGTPAAAAAAASTAAAATAGNKPAAATRLPSSPGLSAGSGDNSWDAKTFIVTQNQDTATPAGVPTADMEVDMRSRRKLRIKLKPSQQLAWGAVLDPLHVATPTRHSSGNSIFSSQSPSHHSSSSSKRLSADDFISNDDCSSVMPEPAPCNCLFHKRMRDSSNSSELTADGLWMGGGSSLWAGGGVATQGDEAERACKRRKRNRCQQGVKRQIGQGAVLPAGNELVDVC